MSNLVAASVARQKSGHCSHLQALLFLGLTWGKDNSLAPDISGGSKFTFLARSMRTGFGLYATH